MSPLRPKVNPLALIPAQIGNELPVVGGGGPVQGLDPVVPRADEPAPVELILGSQIPAPAGISDPIDALARCVDLSRQGEGPVELATRRTPREAGVTPKNL